MRRCKDEKITPRLRLPLLLREFTLAADYIRIYKRTSIEQSLQLNFGSPCNFSYLNAIDSTGLNTKAIAKFNAKESTIRSFHPVQVSLGT